MIKEICVIGHPSKLGGADTELDHQIYAWQKMGVKVHICHTAQLDTNLKNMKMESRGCVYHKPNDWKSLNGMHVISFCNGVFLRNLKYIKLYAKSTTFINCMTWNFRNEIQCQRAGLIDFHLYQTDHALQMVSKKLRSLGKPYRPIRFEPYFRREDFPFHGNRPTDKFRFGRISRGDGQKYNPKQLWIYKNFKSEKPKDGIILGWDKRSKRKFGNNPQIPPYIKCYEEGGITQQEFYKHTDVLILAADTFENLPRVGMEAISSGSILVVDNRGGWKNQVDNGRTGFLCNNEHEFVQRSALLANNDVIRETMRNEALKKLKGRWGLESSMKSWDIVFDRWEKLK